MRIETQEKFKGLASAHKCDDEPYKYPFVGHHITQLQKLKPLEFEKLHGCMGRSLYRPLGWTPNADQQEGEKEEKGTKKASIKKKDSKKEPVKGQLGIKTLSPLALQDQIVEVIDAEKHLCPSKDRLAAKTDFLNHKYRKVQVDISGGLLAHMNNEAFKRSPSSTAGFLLGSFHDGKWSVDYCFGYYISYGIPVVLVGTLRTAVVSRLAYAHCPPFYKIAPPLPPLPTSFYICSSNFHN